MITGISAEQFAVVAEVMQHLDRSPPSARANRRKAQRIDVRTTMSAFLLNHENHPSVRIFTRNISTSGLGFVSRRPFKLGESIAIPLKWPNDERKIIVAKITFVRYVRRGMYEMGAEFQQAVRESDAPAALRQIVHQR